MSEFQPISKEKERVIAEEAAQTQRPDRTYIFIDSTNKYFLFVNPKNGVKKLIVANHTILGFPGIEHPDLIMPLYKEGRTIDNSFRFGSWVRIVREDENRCEVDWCIQPDGRYYADESGFGAEDQDEIELYAYLDENGNFESPFRIRSIGTVSYIGTDREEREAAALAQRTEWEKKNRALGKSDMQITKESIRNALSLISAEEEKCQEVRFPAAGTSCIASLEISKYITQNDTYRYSLHVGVSIAASRTMYSYYVGACDSMAELNGYLNADTTVDEIYYDIMRLSARARGLV